MLRGFSSPGVPIYAISDGAGLVMRGLTPVDEFAEYARNIAAIAEQVPKPEKKKK